MTAVTVLTAEFAEAWTTTLLDEWTERAAELGDLDRQIGDGDFGDNVTAALDRVRAARADSGVVTSGFGPAMTTLSAGFLASGGTSGPLLGLWFDTLATGVDRTEVELAEFAASLEKGTATIQRLGGAKVGDKTMVDALVPAAQALTAAADQPAAAALSAAADAAEQGAESTRELRANRGRASYVGDIAVGVLDPGAAFIALVLRAAANAAG